MRNKWKYLSLVTILLLSGCGDSPTTLDTELSTNGTETKKTIKTASCNTNTSATTCPSAPSVEDKCSGRGGEIFYFGFDNNSNGLLDESEIDVSKNVVICNGYRGLQGETGADGKDGIDGEDGATGQAGQDGQDGADGYNSLITSEEIPAGATCANGGIQFEIGIDTNRNSTLDTIEVIQTQTICLASSTTATVATKIHEVQGSGATSPMQNEEVTVEAIVTADYQDSTLKGFYIQEEDADVDGDETTSEGVFVYDPALLTDVSVGDKVQLTGTAAEFYDLTQIKDLSEVVIISQGEALPTAQTVTLPMASSTAFEKYEGMRVTFTQDLFATDVYNLSKYGEVLLSSTDRLYKGTQIADTTAGAQAIADANILNQIILDDHSTEKYISGEVIHPAPGLSRTNVLRVGDKTANVSGIMSYGYSAYRIQPTAGVTFTNDNPRPTNAPGVSGNFKLAVTNVLNYFTTVDDGSSICGTHNQGCRGADSVEELERQTAKMKAALEKLDAAVIGLAEIQNDGGITAAAIANLLPNYAHVENPNGANSELGSDVITVGYIYDTTKVELVGTSKTIADGAYQGAFDDNNRKPLAQTFKDIATGEVFTAINNHLKSKGSNCGGAPDDDASDLQGNCNGTRTKGAEDLISWAGDLQVETGDDDIIIIGDLNAYAKEDPIKTLETAGFVNRNSDAYTYVYYGEAGSLDYAMPNSAFNSKVADVKVWHIDADESWVFDYNKDATSSSYGRPKPDDYLTNLYEPNEYRMSDHDPIIVGFNFSAPSNVAPTANAGSNQTVTAGDTVTLDGSSSDDTDGTIASYVWSENGTEIGTGETLDKNDFAVGTHTVTLTITDDGGATAIDTVVITVEAASGGTTVLWNESFETDGQSTRYTASEVCTDNTGDFFTRTDGSNIGSFYQVSGQDGSYYYAAMDTDGSPCTAKTQTLTFNAIDITGKSSLVFKGLFAEDDDGTKQDWDVDSSVVVEYQIDGGSFQPIMAFEATGGTNTEPGLDTDFDGIADGTLLTDTLTEFTANIPTTGSSLVVKVTINNLDSGDEDIAFDNFSVEGN